jgi:magnesium transporter
MPARERTLIKINLHVNESSIEDGTPLEAISEALDRPDELLWIDVTDPTADDLAILRQEFNFHPLALEDISNDEQRPKLDTYDGFALLFFRAPVPRSDDQRSCDLVQVGMFFGQNYVVTVHRQPVAALETMNERWRKHIAQVGDYSAGMLLYSILDSIVDAYFPVLDEISDRMEALEERVFNRFEQSTQGDIFQLKKELVRIRRVLAPEREVLNILLRRDTPIFESEVLVYLQDVYDHVLRVTDEVDTYRDLLSSALEFHLAAVSNRLNQVMKTMTALSVVLMSTTLVASIYGMNFVHMPELKWHLGYVWALGLMVSIGAGVFATFRHYDWV